MSLSSSLGNAGTPSLRTLPCRPVLLIAAALGMAGLVPLGLDPQGYTLRVLTLTLLFAAMAQSWNIVGGLANQISLGHAGFFGIGAYTSTILLRDLGVSPWLGMIAGMGLAGLAAAILSVPTFRLKGHYFALVTLAFGEVMRVIANSWSSVTGGPVGISVPFAPNSLWMFQYNTVRPYYYVSLIALVLVSVVFWRIKTGALGYRLRAIKENPDAAEVIGIDTYRAKLMAGLVSAVLTAALGTVYAQFSYFFDPDTIFGVASISVRMALIAIVGGVSLTFGPIVGAFFIIPLEEISNAALAGRAAGLSAFVYGALLIAIILVKPQGLLALFGDLYKRLRKESSR
ncbi:MAG: branched-chain amino acid ABC transporter permease [Magnetospirillum sp.]